VSCSLSRDAGAKGVDKAHTLLAQSNFELAAQFLDRALELEPANLEARELLGVAHLEAGDPEVGRTVRDAVMTSRRWRLMRQHLLQLLPPHTTEAPTSPSIYLYLAQSANDPQEALGYYTTAVAILEKTLKERDAKGKGKASESGDGNEAEEREMAVTALVAMIEIWMSDLWYVTSPFLRSRLMHQHGGSCRDELRCFDCEGVIDRS